MNELNRASADAGASLDRLLEQRSAFFRFLSGRLGDAAAAEDVLQACYLKLVENPPQLRNHETVVVWFYSVLRHAVVDHYRRNVTRARTEEQFAADAPVSYEEEFQSNVCRCVKGVLETLKPEYRKVLQQVDLDGNSVADYAAAEGTTPNNAGVRLHRARKAAATRLAQVCGACAEHKCLDCTCRKTPL